LDQLALAGLDLPDPRVEIRTEGLGPSCEVIDGVPVLRDLELAALQVFFLRIDRRPVGRKPAPLLLDLMVHRVQFAGSRLDPDPPLLESFRLGLQVRFLETGFFATIATPKKILGRIRTMYGSCHQPGPGGGMTTGTCTVTRMLGSEPSIVKTTWPASSTVPATKGDPSFVTVNGSRTVLPPMVQVMVCVVSVEECVQACDTPVFQSPHAGTVMRV